MDFEKFKESLSEVISPLENIIAKESTPLESLTTLNKPIDNPYESGFDEEHPMPTYDQLRNAGFSDYLANQILHGKHSYSDKELFNVLYSPDPVEAYNQMMKAKVDKHIAETDELLKSIKNTL